VHCIVSGGGLNADQWVVEKRINNTYLFPKPAPEKSIARVGYKHWNVYAKKPFGGPLQVLEYLGGYTHKVAITAHRIKAIDENNHIITFKYKDYPRLAGVAKRNSRK
jgi:Putative transposase